MDKFSFFLLLASSFLAAFGQILIKLGADGRQNFIDFVNYWIAFGLSLYVLGAAIWIYVLSKVDVSTVTIFSALTFIFVILGGAFFLGEKISASVIVGAILVSVGLMMVTFEPL